MELPIPAYIGGGVAAVTIMGRRLVDLYERVQTARVHRTESEVRISAYQAVQAYLEDTNIPVEDRFALARQLTHLSVGAAETLAALDGVDVIDTTS